MDGVVIALVSIAAAVAAAGVGYRRFRARSMATVSDEQFVHDYYAHHPTDATSEAILGERNRIAKVLGLPPEKLAPQQNLRVLSERLTYLADFSVAWNDLADDAAQAREAGGLPPRQRPPLTIGEIVEDLLCGGS